MRVRRDVCRAILLTSLVWMLVDVLVLFHYIDSGSSSSSLRAKSAAKLRAERIPDNKGQDDGGDDEKEKDNSIRKSNAETKLVRSAADVEVQNRLDDLLRGLSFSNGGPGEMGSGVLIDASKENERKEKFKLNQFNLMASDMMSINRTLPDYRSRRCVQNAEQYKDLDLPPVSIIIVFHNEAWSTLLRTLHSVMNRSPLRLIKEIILIDDFSERDYLKEPLDLYVQRFPILVQIVHLKERSGLIRARLEGSRLSKGKILLFLDAHVEVTDGWLEPLISRVASDQKRVVAPIIDVISDDNFEYITASDTTWGGFNWHLNFRWYPVPKREMERRNHDRSSPIQTPTIAGGLFAIDRQFFYDIGAYDEGMQVWGGENLEISFRVWMCGGSLEIHPCSRVGHVFRKQTPYTFPGGTARVIHHNAARTAEVWMDDYKKFFYQVVPAAKNVDIGDLNERLSLRKNLQCRTFRWYLENIYPEAPIPVNFKSIGQFKNVETQRCLDTLGNKEGGLAGTATCHGIGGNQAWSFTSNGEVRSDEICLTPKGRSQRTEIMEVILEKCSTTGTSRNQQFDYDVQTTLLRHRVSGGCLELESEVTLLIKKCNPTSGSQRWELEGYKE
ncbi:unnamed protein product [Anisakis simplex]|uniref:Polypeptide N-acetylgalactosaminyltransferase n=1 Tax=Anisakis simplex TaxID=6269 RepID=A0A0M3JRM6_ANISI|nr:unnamed protein product [Anisakis simplex]